MTEIVGHLVVFIVVAIGALIVPLLLGRLVRPKLPTPEKDAIYECGEPTIGSSYVQFDLRFYTVALLFIIFDVEVAFFFPWAMIYGGATQLADARLHDMPAVNGVTPAQELTAKLLDMPASEAGSVVPLSSEAAFQLATIGLFDILVFFGVLLVGFAYVWRRGDLDWVRALVLKAQQAPARPRTPTTLEQRPEHQTVA
jgi:NADH-quinone oxidoreductase subunit A